MAFGALIVLGLATGGCKVKFTCGGTSDAPTSFLDGAKLEDVIAASFATEHNLEVTVACPKDRPLSPADTFACEVTTDDGTSLTLTVVQKDDRGNVSWELASVLVDTRKDLAEIKAKLGASAVITCPKRTLHLKQAGDTATCDVRDGDGRAQLVIHLEDVETRRITLTVAPSAS